MIWHDGAQDIVHVQILQKAAEEGYGKAAANFMVKAAVDKVIAEEEGYAKAAAKFLVKAAMERIVAQVSHLPSQISWMSDLTQCWHAHSSRHIGSMFLLCILS